MKNKNGAVSRKDTSKSWWQRQRINGLRLSALLFLPLCILTQPVIAFGSLGFALMDTVGILLVLVGVFGRFWCIMYIGGRKAALVFQDGPYSISRHPLYLFSTIASVGLGLMLGSLTLAVLIGVIVFLILFYTAAHEEVFLRKEFGSDYDKYAARVPRILPNLSLWKTERVIQSNIKQLRTNFQDGLVFVSFIPISRLIVWSRETLDLGLITLL